MKNENETLVRVWVADQPEGQGYDGTDNYLRSAKVTYEERDGMILMPWSEFMAARAAVANVGHGKDNDGEIIAGSPDLVACQPDAEGSDEAVQQMDSRNGVVSA